MRPHVRTPRNIDPLRPGRTDRLTDGETGEHGKGKPSARRCPPCPSPPSTPDSPHTHRPPLPPSHPIPSHPVSINSSPPLPASNPPPPSTNQPANQPDRIHPSIYLHLYLYFNATVSDFACRYLYAPNASAPPSRISAYRPMPRPAALPCALVDVRPAVPSASLGVGSPSCLLGRGVSVGCIERGLGGKTGMGEGTW